MVWGINDLLFFCRLSSFSVYSRSAGTNNWQKRGGAAATCEWQLLGLRGPSTTQSHQASFPLQPLTHFLCHVWPSPQSAPQRSPPRPNTQQGSCVWLCAQVNSLSQAPRSGSRRPLSFRSTKPATAKLPECIWKPSESEKDISADRDKGRAAAETKTGSVTAEGCFIRMRGSIVHLHKGQRTPGVNFTRHVATNFRAEVFLVAVTPTHPSTVHASPRFFSSSWAERIGGYLTVKDVSHLLRISGI